jgi:plastocyanin
MTNGKFGRRELLKIAGAGAMGVVLPGFQAKKPSPKDDPNTVVIRIGNNYIGGQWYFDPFVVAIEKGQKVFWESSKWGTTISAYHPSNWNHELRIPENAKPFNSGLLGDNYQNTFEWTFDVEGTYDYFSRNHEERGMVGRIIVGKPGGPAETRPPGYGDKDGKAYVWPNQIKVFKAMPPSAEVVQKKTIAFPKNLLFRDYPYGLNG